MKMKKFLYILIPSFLISGFLIAEQKGDPETQVPALEWYKGYGTDGGDHAHCFSGLPQQGFQHFSLPYARELRDDQQ